MATILLLNDDLLDSSRIAGHGRAAGHTVVTARDANALRNALHQQPNVVILDLHNPSLDVAVLVPELRTAGVAMIVGYGSHVDTIRLKMARQAGCDVVLPRSAFFEKLDDHFTTWTT